jgi:hypothetical protein
VPLSSVGVSVCPFRGVSSTGSVFGSLGFWRCSLFFMPIWPISSSGVVETPGMSHRWQFSPHYPVGDPIITQGAALGVHTSEVAPFFLCWFFFSSGVVETPGITNLLPQSPLDSTRTGIIVIQDFKITGSVFRTTGLKGTPFFLCRFSYSASVGGNTIRHSLRQLNRSPSI